MPVVIGVSKGSVRAGYSDAGAGRPETSLAAPAPRRPFRPPEPGFAPGGARGALSSCRWFIERPYGEDRITSVVCVRPFVYRPGRGIPMRHPLDRRPDSAPTVRAPF